MWVIVVFQKPNDDKFAFVTKRIKRIAAGLEVDLTESFPFASHLLVQGVVFSSNAGVVPPGSDITLTLTSESTVLEVELMNFHSPSRDYFALLDNCEFWH
jgi:hypothetical protein